MCMYNHYFIHTWKKWIKCIRDATQDYFLFCFTSFSNQYIYINMRKKCSTTFFNGGPSIIVVATFFYETNGLNLIRPALSSMAIKLIDSMITLFEKWNVTKIMKITHVFIFNDIIYTIFTHTSKIWCLLYR